jgi:hypothetical protein
VNRLIATKNQQGAGTEWQLYHAITFAIQQTGD